MKRCCGTCRWWDADQSVGFISWEDTYECDAPVPYWVYLMDAPLGIDSQTRKTHGDECRAYEPKEDAS